MKDFRQTSKALRFGLMIAVCEIMSQDTAVRFSYAETLNRRMLENLEDINSIRPGVKDQFDQIKALNALFGDGMASPAPHLVAAVEFLSTLTDELLASVVFSPELKTREWWFPPRITAFTLTVNGSDIRFVDEAYAAS